MSPDDAAQVAQLAAEYRSILRRMDDAKVEQGGRTKHWNRLVDELQVIQLALRRTSAGRSVITALADDDNVTISLWSATFALDWEPARARRRLELVSADGGLDGFTASVTLRQFDAGHLDTTWTPPLERAVGKLLGT